MAASNRTRSAGSPDCVSCEMLPGLISSPSPVYASCRWGSTQNDPGSRGTNTNSNTANGSATARLRSRMAQQRGGGRRMGAGAQRVQRGTQQPKFGRVQRHAPQRLAIQAGREQQEQRRTHHDQPVAAAAPSP
jgi:hypothetical protein